MFPRRREPSFSLVLAAVTTFFFMLNDSPASAFQLPRRGSFTQCGRKKKFCLSAKMKNRKIGRIVSQTEHVEVSCDGSDAWRCAEVAEILRRGGCGVLPTCTGYGIVAKLDSRDGIERILRIKGLERCKKPLSLLCSDLATIDRYCYGIDRGVFRTLKSAFPGPHTFILPASTALPKQIFIDGKGGKHGWARQTLGVRMPDDPVLRALQDDLLGGDSLIVSSIPSSDDGGGTQFAACLDPDAPWYSDVDFVVDAGERPLDGSTIYDFTNPSEPSLVREGIGELLNL
mmetsp:Transcript_47376/g.92417  ORF Transcript_47376/g.92417 Transcript_47376/m.92417 type:complete len:286 (+) Transcript_47376:168-1025(+)